MKFPVENVSKNYLSFQQKNSVEIDCRSIQQKNFVMVIHQELKQIYGDLTGVFQFDRKFLILPGVTPEYSVKRKY